MFERIVGKVSIPYEREGISKEDQLIVQEDQLIVFQFPTNGKAYPKRWEMPTTAQIIRSFNSLRTGRHIQREPSPCFGRKTWASFNSLRTGRHIQRSC